MQSKPHLMTYSGYLKSLRPQKRQVRSRKYPTIWHRPSWTKPVYAVCRCRHNPPPKPPNRRLLHNRRASCLSMTTIKIPKPLFRRPLYRTTSNTTERIRNRHLLPIMNPTLSTTVFTTRQPISNTAVKRRLKFRPIWIRPAASTAMTALNMTAVPLRSKKPKTVGKHRSRASGRRPKPNLKTNLKTNLKPNLKTNLKPNLKPNPGQPVNQPARGRLKPNHARCRCWI